MEKGTILLTGASGFLGNATALKALTQGYKVKAAVRRESAIVEILRGTSAKIFHAKGTLSFHVVEDMTRPDAFIDLATDCSYIIHIAHPLAGAPGGGYSAFAEGSVNAVLRAAEANPGIKRLVWTSSVFGVVPWEFMLGTHPDLLKTQDGNSADVPALTGESRIPVPPQPPEDAPPVQRDNHAKALGASMLRRHAARHPDAGFEIVILTPGWIMGPNEAETTKKEAFSFYNTNSLLMFLFFGFSIAIGLGKPMGQPAPMLAATVHIDDCADAHVNALSVDLRGRKVAGFLLMSDGPTGPVLDEAIAIVREGFPDEAARILPDAHMETLIMKFDAISTERDLLRRPFKSYKQTVYDTILWYKTLPEA